MTLARLKADRRLEAQLNPHIQEIGYDPKHYSQNRDAITESLVEQGHLIMPTEMANYRKAQIELIRMLASQFETKKEQHILIPSGSPILFDEESRLSKIPTQKVARYDNLPPGMKSKTLYQLTQDMINATPFAGRLIGYDFADADGQRSTVQLVDIIRAEEMMKDSYNAENVKDYSIHRKAGRRYKPGANALVSGIPSLEDAPSYDVVLNYVVLADKTKAERMGLTVEEAALTFELKANHTCKKDRLIQLGYGREMKTSQNLRSGHEDLECLHDIFAYLAYQKFISERPLEQGESPEIVPPLFYHPSDDFKNAYFWPLYERVLKEVPDPVTGKLQRAPLAMGEIEGVLWAVIGYRNEQKKRVPK